MLDHVDYCRSEERPMDEEDEEEEEEAGGPRMDENSPSDEGQQDDRKQQQTPAEDKGKKRSRNCFLCNKTYASQFTLNRHLTTQHKIKVSPTTRVLQCPVDKCNGQFNYMGGLRDHLRKAHSITIVGGTVHRFTSMEAFLTWKQGEEKLTHTKFVRPHGKYSRHDGAQVHQFYCHRSGNYRSEGKGLRKLKSKGSCKMGAVCPATITAYQLPAGSVDVKYFSTHVGHFTDLEELYFSNEERSVVNAMVSKGLPFGEVLDHVRDSLCGEMAGLAKFVDKDFKLINKTFDLWQHDKQDKTNALGVTTLVEELTNLGEDNPVLHSVLPWTSGGTLVRDELVVVVMNGLQSEMLRKFGHDGMVCVDSTTAADGDDAEFHLISILTVDSFGQAFPCAFCLTYTPSESILTTFFEAVRAKAEKICPRYFMCDSGEAYYESWCSIMDEPAQRLYSSWQIDQIWRKNLSKIVGKPYQKASAYKALRVMLREPNQKKFELLMSAFKFHMLESKYTESFGKYLESEWTERAARWAFCHRSEECARCDLELEAMHLMLTHIYPDGKVKRIDTTLQAIFRFLRDKSFHKLVQCCAEMCADRLSTIKSRHHSSLSLSLKNIVPFEARKWIVKSQQQGEFLVERSAEECGADCLLRCAPCGLCVHTFSCSCTDSIIRGTLCKHIHLVGRFIRDVVSDMELVVEETPNRELVVVDELSEEMLRQIAAVSHADVNIKIEELVAEIDACSRQIAVSASGINDFEVLKHLREGLEKLADVARVASLSSANSGNVICIPLEDLQSVLYNEALPETSSRS